LRCIEHCWIDFATELGTQAILLFAQGGLQFLLGDLAASDAGDIRSAIDVPHVGFNAPESEREGDQNKETLGDSLVVANEIEHAL